MTQAQALEILKTGANVFLTGEPGSGKTHTINAYVRYLRDHGVEPAITASTGIAATHIGGMTIHSWSGIGIKQRLTEYDLDHLTTNEYLSKRLNRAKVLIIDEISMLSAATLTMVDQVCRALRHSHLAFGGLQVVLVGDFFQLPPVSRPHEEVADFAFRSHAWASLRPITCYLHEQHRQDDKIFLTVLGALRAGKFDMSHQGYLEKRFTYYDDIPTGVTKLFSHNLDVDRINTEELHSLPGGTRSYAMTATGKDSVVEALKKGCLSPEELELKEGAVVMFTKNNQPNGFANGTLGIVVGFDRDSKHPIVKTRQGQKITASPMDWTVEEEGKVKAVISQVPLRLAWAITVHKSQGLSLDAAAVDLSGAFEYGQGYVALSRVRRLEGLHLLGVNERALEVHPGIAERDHYFKAESRAARESFANLTSDELHEMHRNFLIAAGGTAEKVKAKKSSRKTPVKPTKPRGRKRPIDKK